VRADLTGETICRRAFRHGVRRDAPCFDGHFDGDPIAPGAVLLGHAAALILDHGRVLTEVVRLKFLRPLRPEEAFEVIVSDGANASTIIWRTADETIAKAQVTLRRADG